MQNAASGEGDLQSHIPGNLVSTVNDSLSASRHVVSCLHDGRPGKLFFKSEHWSVMMLVRIATTLGIHITYTDC